SSDLTAWPRGGKRNVCRFRQSKGGPCRDRRYREAARGSSEIFVRQRAVRFETKGLRNRLPPNGRWHVGDRSAVARFRDLSRTLDRMPAPVPDRRKTDRIGPARR